MEEQGNDVSVTSEPNDETKHGARWLIAPLPLTSAFPFLWNLASDS